MIKFSTTLFFIFSTFVIFGQIPDGYYDDAIGKTGDELKAALHDIIDDHDEYSYNDLRDFILEDTDEDPENEDNVILLYSGISRDKDLFGGNIGNWNREHVWAKSHGDFGNTPPAGTDAHHIRPTDVKVNSTRGNLDFDMGGNPVPGAPGCNVDSDSFEPRDEVKGDVARMIFYMAVRYEGGGNEPDLELIDKVNNSPQPLHGKLSILLNWNDADLPDDFEKNRNEVVFGYQENRNPFIDYPEFAESIWGDPTAIATTNEIQLNCYPNPVTSVATISYTRNATYQFSVIGIDGKVYTQGLTEHDKTQIDFSSMNPGLYFIILSDASGKPVDQFKLIKTSR